MSLTPSLSLSSTLSTLSTSSTTIPLYWHQLCDILNQWLALRCDKYHFIPIEITCTPSVCICSNKKKEQCDGLYGIYLLHKNHSNNHQENDNDNPQTTTAQIPQFPFCISHDIYNTHNPYLTKFVSLVPIMSMRRVFRNVLYVIYSLVRPPLSVTSKPPRNVHAMIYKYSCKFLPKDQNSTSKVKIECWKRLLFYNNFFNDFTIVNSE